ncbi:MAG TPA: guanylate kinase [Candidatus Limnocylindrales bacterium]|nr:guanylate kinase [Candidatus Limnocylindrales bacterium]
MSDRRARDASVTGAPGALVIIISGPSGVGKDTIIRVLRDRHPDARRQFIVTYKTRAPRRGEVAGVDYNFVSIDDFLRMQVEGDLLEASEVHGHWSGTPRDQVVAAIQEGRHAILKIDVQGADKIKALIPEALRIFVAPPSDDERLNRLTGRQTETAEEIARRDRDAEYEMSRAPDYDHVVVNETDQVEETARRIDEIIRAEQDANAERRISL